MPYILSKVGLFNGNPNVVLESPVNVVMIAYDYCKTQQDIENYILQKNKKT